MVSGGGAQLTDRVLIYEAFRRGHQLEILTPEHAERLQDRLEGFDFAIVSNCTRFAPQLLRQAFGLAPWQRAEGKPKVPFAVFHHDYKCRWQLYYPLEGKCMSCVYVPPWKVLFEEAMLNIFMSLLHRDACFSLMPSLSSLPHMLCPSLFGNLADFRAGTKKPGTVLGVNAMLPYKGRANVLKYAKEHPELRFTFAGAAEGEGELPSNCFYLGPVSDRRLRELYAESESFIHLAPTPQPCERTCIEAKLSGCWMITNANAGITSYGEWGLPDADFRKWLEGYPARAWEKLEAYA